MSLALIDGEFAVYVAQSTLHNSDVTFGFAVGSRLPLLHTAIGRALLCAGDAKLAAQLIATCPVERYTSDTVINRNDIKKRVNQCRKQGYALVCNEFEGVVTGIAVPVSGAGDPLAAVGTSCAGSSVKNKTRQTKIIDHLTQLAHEYSRSGVLSNSSLAAP